MRYPIINSALMFMILVPSSSCGLMPDATPRYPDLGPMLDDMNDGLRRQQALQAAQAVITTQLALTHLLGALSRAAQDQLGDALPFTALGTPDATAEPHYELDAASQTGSVTVVRGGREAVSLQFGFARTAIANGLQFGLTGTTGTVEGFDFQAPDATITFRQGGGAAGWQGEVLMRIELSRGQADVRTARVVLDLPNGAPKPGVTLGSLVIEVPAQAARFDGTVLAGPTGPVTRGGLDIAGRRAYDVRLAGGDAIEITPLPAAAP